MIRLATLFLLVALPALGQPNHPGTIVNWGLYGEPFLTELPSAPNGQSGAGTAISSMIAASPMPFYVQPAVITLNTVNRDSEQPLPTTVSIAEWPLEWVLEAQSYLSRHPALKAPNGGGVDLASSEMMQPQANHHYQWHPSIPWNTWSSSSLSRPSSNSDYGWNNHQWPANPGLGLPSWWLWWNPPTNPNNWSNQWGWSDWANYPAGSPLLSAWTSKQWPPSYRSGSSSSLNAWTDPSSFLSAFVQKLQHDHDPAVAPPIRGSCHGVKRWSILNTLIPIIVPFIII